jgi:acetyl-CoA synthetase
MMAETTALHKQPVVWQPPPDAWQNANARKLASRLGIDNYEDLLAFAIAHPEAYWEAVLTDLGIIFDSPYDTIMDTSDRAPFIRWATSGQLNIYASCIAQWITKTDKRAFTYVHEDGTTSNMTYSQLDEEVNKLCHWLTQKGFGKGDVMALYMPMTPNIVIAFFAIVKLGGVLLPLFSGYGPQAISTRLNDANARVVFAHTSSIRRGKKTDMGTPLCSALADTPSVEWVISDTVLSDHCSMQDTGIRTATFSKIFARKSIPFAAAIAESNSMVMLIYTSGTTGRPKGAVHSHIGFPVKAAHDLRYHFELNEESQLYWMTDMGWMMGPWELFGAFINGASVVLFEGAPDFPTADRQWEIIAELGVTHLGVSPNFIRTLTNDNRTLYDIYDFSRLQTIGSTGSPWDVESWLWIFNHVLARSKPIINYSGGTEISGGIISGNFLTPLKPCAFSGAMLGMDVDVLNEHGEPLLNEVGELVIRKPWLGMTHSFWQDYTRYLASYWETYDGIWRHGDFALKDNDGLYYILGRSDDTIKVSGKRLGPAEVEGILNSHALVRESAAIGVPDPAKDNVIVTFSVLAKAPDDIEALRNELMNLLVLNLGKPLKPRAVRFVKSIPKTRNAKILRRLVRSVYLGEKTGDISSLEHPLSLEHIKNNY